MQNVNLYKNKGMYIESLVEKTIDYINNKDIGLFEKRNIPINIYSVKGNKIEAYLKEKSLVDFCGVFNGKHIEFETKQTDKDFFKFNLFKKHQLNYLIKSNKHKSLSFLIIHFYVYDKTFAIEINQLKDIYNKFKSKPIPLTFFENNCYELILEFPGILTIIDFIKKYIVT